MKLLQKYLRKQGFWPLIITLSALSILAILTQSLSTLDLIVENRQSAGTFFYITLLAIPQLVAVILPLAVFIAFIYAINRLNTDSELVVSKASGLSPWGIASPIIRLSILAAIIHLVINIAVQPVAFRQMRAELLKVKTDLASQVIRAGEFNSPAPGLTLYSKTISPGGALEDVVIHDARNPNGVQTYISKTGRITTSDNTSRLGLSNGHIEEIVDGGRLDLIEFETYSLDLSDILAVDSVLRLKTSDRYLHELLHPDQREFVTEKSRLSMISEGHSRLSSPLYNIALAMLALCFLIRGELQRTGYGRRIALCVVFGFTIRISGFAISSAAESNIIVNILQYAFPTLIILISLFIILLPNRITKPRFFRKRENINALNEASIKASQTL
ncbi:MAG: LptF/LptG family permease [Maricaulaceae bacterium]